MFRRFAAYLLLALTVFGPVQGRPFTAKNMATGTVYVSVTPRFWDS